jgi:hypothetical protein
VFFLQITTVLLLPLVNDLSTLLLFGILLGLQDLDFYFLILSFFNFISLLFGNSQFQIVFSVFHLLFDFFLFLLFFILSRCSHFRRSLTGQDPILNRSLMLLLFNDPLKEGSDISYFDNWSRSCFFDLLRRVFNEDWTIFVLNHGYLLIKGIYNRSNDDFTIFVLHHGYLLIKSFYNWSVNDRYHFTFKENEGIITACRHVSLFSNEFKERSDISDFDNFILYIQALDLEVWFYDPFKMG